jgi:hypothetical protein
MLLLRIIRTDKYNPSIVIPDWQISVGLSVLCPNVMSHAADTISNILSLAVWTGTGVVDELTTWAIIQPNINPPSTALSSSLS